jgi:hypothetical protein
VFWILDEMDSGLVAGSKFEARNWDDEYDQYDDTPTDRSKLDQLAARVQALEDNS